MAKKASKSTENIKLQKQFIDKFFPDLSKILNTSGSDEEFKKAVEDHKDAITDKFKEIGFDAGDASLEEIAKGTYNDYVNDLWNKTYDARKKLSDRDPDYYLLSEALYHIGWSEGKEDFDPVDENLPKGALRNALIRHGVFNEEEGPEDDVESSYFKDHANRMAEFVKQSRSRGIKDLKRGPISKSKGKSADTLDTLRYHFRNKLEDENPELAKKFVNAKSLKEIKDLVNNNRDSLKGFMDSRDFIYFDEDDFDGYAKYTNSDVKGLMRNYGKEGSLHDAYNKPEDLAKGFDDATLSEFNKVFGLLGPRQAEKVIESKPKEFVDSSSPEIAKEAQQIVNNNDKRDDEVNNANVEKALRKTIPGSEPDPLGINISNGERANWNGGEDMAVDDATVSEMDNALASRTRPVKPGSEMLKSAKPKGLLGAGMLYSRDGNIPKPSEERPLDANSLEQITESNPEAVQEALPDTPIAEEARQITDDNNARNDEVNNGAAEETIGMGWNNVLVHDDYDPRVEANNEYEYPENVGNPGVITEKDEDFAGPDELPATIDQIRDEDFVGPDEQLDKYRGGLPEELYTEPVYDTSDYNFDWDAVIETLPYDLQEDMESLPEEDKEEISKLLHIKSKGISAPASSFSGSNPAIDIGKTSHGTSSVKKPGMYMLGMSLGSANAHVSGNTNKPEHIDSVNSIASAGPIPPKEANATEGKAIAGSNNAIPRSNGTIGSGAGLLFHKVGMLDISKSAPEIPVLGHTSTANELNAPSVEDTIDDMKEGLVETIEAKLNANPEQAESLGFGHRYKHWDYKGISLDEMSIKDLNELVKLID